MRLLLMIANVRKCCKMCPAGAIFVSSFGLLRTFDFVQCFVCTADYERVHTQLHKCAQSTVRSVQSTWLGRMLSSDPLTIREAW